MTTSCFFGMSTSIDLRLCSRAPRISMWSSSTGLREREDRDLADWLKELDATPLLIELFELGIVFLVATVVYFFVRWSLVRAVRKLVANTEAHWDDQLVTAGLFGRVSHVAPAFVVYYGMNFFPDLPEELTDGFAGSPSP